jgi:epoxyqueuosine reductase
MNLDYKNSVISYCERLGLDTIGFTECRKFTELKTYFQDRREKGLENEFEAKEIENRINPFFYMEEGKTIISIAFPYLFNDDFSEDISFSKYTQGMDYHFVVAEYLKKICEFIEGLGGKAKYFVDSNSLPERYIAKLCGVGFIGKNNIVITEKYGSYVFLGEIITDIYMEPDKPSENKCGDCDICEKTCPTGAIKGENIPNICLSYITQKKDIEDGWFQKFNGRVFGCDSCQKICPYNIDVSFSQVEEFRPFDFMKEIDIQEIVNIDKRTFKNKYSKSSCGWRGKNVLQRNILINMLSSKRGIAPGEINSSYVKDYYNRLLWFFKL